MRNQIKKGLIILILVISVNSAFCKDYLITDYGAIGDDQSINTIEIQKTIDIASENGGGRVVVSSGTFLTGTLFFKDNVNLHIEMGAVLKGSPHLSDYPVLELQTIRSFTEGYTKKALIYAEDVHNIAITGLGTIDGNSDCEEFVNAKDISLKPLGIKLVSCSDITVRDVQLRQAGLWMQHYLACENLTIDNIKVYNHHHHTNDGLDIDGCKNVRVSNCFIDSHDDAIALKSTGPAVCENITITNCIVKSHCHGIKMGTESTGGFKRINISNCVVLPSEVKHPKSDLEFPVITAIALEITDGGTMENINVNNIAADKVFAPIFIKLGNRARLHRDDAPTPPVGIIKNIVISNLQATNAGPFSSSITGFPGHYVENITLENIYIEHVGGAKLDEIMKVIPENEKDYPEIKMFGNKWYGPRLPSYGLFIRHAKNIHLKNVQFKLLNDDARIPIFTEDVINDVNDDSILQKK